jgi:hypothetical protein
MAIRFLEQVRNAIKSLNPEEVREAAERPVRVLLQANSSASYARMEDYLAPANLSHDKRMEIARFLTRACDGGAGSKFHLVFYEQGGPPPAGWDEGVDAFRFNVDRPEHLVAEVLRRQDRAALPLARLFPPFRQSVTSDVIHKISLENALFCVLTSLPNVIPSLAELPWAAGEFASDTAVLTANQIRMAFLLAAASDRPVGYREQRSEIGSIVAGAWGWRALARELVGKIPFGGGIVPKAAVSYAGTYVVGLSLERIYRIGYGLTRAERREAYEAALQKGKAVAAGLVARARQG